MTGKITKHSRRKYDITFKEDVLKMIASGRTVSSVAEALGIGENIIYRWKNKANSTSLNYVSSSDLSKNSDSTIEMERLRAELRRTEQERDILKKALGIFSRGI